MEDAVGASEVSARQLNLDFVRGTGEFSFLKQALFPEMVIVK